ncbi:type I-B CRISPR-associated protein Cas5 [Chloroflexus islandicus]|uniref:Type I-B CRISPR-associated protein Cas5 n=1 Tax=Chloroflexus islandicus TaxID=1707952 RepID=A0A178M3T0_9CHLR|nr:type I-B CRISPR-associated protein Cas5b [Chloroflexus islandicus]OAN42901.1 type I-B CRISPR-associated protein Cas5 [Chloroflexus islandicus]
MQVLKIVLEGVTTSFRYPHFMLGVQPSFPLPPPATIYGHVCSALGEWVEPEGLAFAYHFTVAGEGHDLEHIHVLSAASGKLPGGERKVLEGNVNPFKRHILLFPRLVLYLNRPDWIDAFRSPRYPVVLGRSQDLAAYTQIEVIELQPAAQVYFEHTLLPFALAAQAPAGVVTLMPRWINYRDRRRPTFARYLMLAERVTSAQMLRFGDQQPVYWSDPTAPRVDGLPLGLWFHSFVGAADEAITMA